MSTYKIEENIPAPPDWRSSRSKYPFSEMKVGDSFVVSEEEFLAARQASYDYGRRHKMRFSTRKPRIWRIE